jgi:MFS family permease
VADITTPDKRAKSFGLMGAAFGIGFIIGPAMGGVLSGISPRLPFWVSACLSLANGLYGLFILPESLAPERRAGFSWQRANPLGSLRLLRSHPQLMGFAFVHFLYNLAHQSLASVFVLYAPIAITGRRPTWMGADDGRCVFRDRAGWAGRTARRAFGEAPHTRGGPVVRRIGIRRLWSGDNRTMVRGRHSHHVDVGPVRTVSAGPDDTPRRTE